MTIIDRLSAAWQALRGAGVHAAAVNHAEGTLSASELVRMRIFGPVGTSFGPAVTDQTAMQVGTVYACLEKLGGVVLQLPLHQFRLDTEGDRSRITPPTRLWWLLNESPSAAWTAASWKEWIVRCVKLRGDQHTEIVRNRMGEPVSLNVHHPDCVQARRVDGRLRYDVMDVDTGDVRGVDQDDMLHFAGFGFDGVRSLSAIKWAARNSIANTLGAAAYMGKTIAEGGMPRVALTYPATLNPAQTASLREQFVGIYGGGEGGRLPLVLTNGGTAKELNISPVDMELMAARKMDKADICEAMGVPPIIIGDSEKTSSWGTGVEQVTLGWVRFSVQPMLARWEEELNRKLFRQAGQFVEFSLEALLRGDSKSQSEAFRAALGGPGTGDGWMSVNEVRKLKNLPRLNDPEADKPFRAQRGTSTAAPPAG